MLDNHLMPVMDGLTAIKMIRSMTNQEINSIPIIAMTEHAFREDVENCKEAGMNDYFSKPLDIQKILSVISKYRKKDDND